MRLNSVFEPRSGLPLGWVDVVDLPQAREQRAVDVAVLREGQHGLVDDHGGLVRIQVALDEALARVQVDLAVVRAVAVHVEEHDEPVVDTRPADAPGIDDRDRVDARGLG